MPTQEEINAAQVELDIANDNYAALADKYNQYNRIFNAYKNSSPEAQERASGLMQEALNNYEQLKQQIYAAEDRIAVAQNRVNSINETIAAQQTAAASPVYQWGQKRRTITYDNPVNWDMVTPWVQIPEKRENITQGNKVKMTSTYVPNWTEPQYSNTTIWNVDNKYWVPPEIQEVRWLRWNEYLQWLNNLENQWYTVIWQTAYKDWNSYKTNVYTTPVYTPAEIQRVRWLSGADYLRWMQDLGKYRGYNVVNENAYKNWSKWALR